MPRIGSISLSAVSDKQGSDTGMDWTAIWQWTITQQWLPGAVAGGASAVFAGAAFKRAGTVERDSQARTLADGIDDLTKLLASKAYLGALRRIEESPPVIRAAGDDYGSRSQSPAYLDDPNAKLSIKKGGAQNHDEYTAAYAVVLEVFRQASRLVPEKERLRRLWLARHETETIYEGLRQALSAIYEARWELRKSPFTAGAPDSRQFAGSGKTPMSDAAFGQILRNLNSSRPSGTRELNLPHAE
jgi:hypothetical protein